MFLLPLGPLPKGGHGGKDYNTRTQVTFAVFEESILSFSEDLHLFFLESDFNISAIKNIAEGPYVSPVG